MKKTNRKGFTIVELVIVIAVIAILSAVLIPTFSGITKRAEATAAFQDARNAYVKYLSENPEFAATDLIIKVDDDTFVVYLDGNIVTEYIPDGENEKKVAAVFTTEDLAKAYIVKTTGWAAAKVTVVDSTNISTVVSDTTTASQGN